MKLNNAPLVKTLALITLAAILAAGACAAAVPPMISYQGKLMQPTGIPVPDGIYSIRFAIYDAPTAGNTLWSEVSPSVQVKGGLFATMLGSVVNLPANIFDGSSRFFGVKVGTDLEMTPRQQVASVASAVKASSADVALTVPDGAITTSKLANSAITTDKIADGAITAVKIDDQAISTEKIADGAVGRDQFAALSGIVWKVPFYMGLDAGTDWRPGVNAIWDITQMLHNAEVPGDAQMILVGICAPFVSNISVFACQDAAGQTIAEVKLSADIAQMTYVPIYPLFGTPIAIPAATRRLNYTSTGGYTASYTVKDRSLIVYGWR